MAENRTFAVLPVRRAPSGLPDPAGIADTTREPDAHPFPPHHRSSTSNRNEGSHSVKTFAKPCPVCRAVVEIPEEATGSKITCGACGSVHRVLADPAVAGLRLKTLIEVLNPPVETAPVAEAEAEVETEIEAEADGAGARPAVQLKTWRDRYREESAETSQRRAPAGRSARGTRARRSRS